VLLSLMRSIAMYLEGIRVARAVREIDVFPASSVNRGCDAQCLVIIPLYGKYFLIGRLMGPDLNQSCGTTYRGEIAGSLQRSIFQPSFEWVQYTDEYPYTYVDERCIPRCDR
jgi:hypothetical protein